MFIEIDLRDEDDHSIQIHSDDPERYDDEGLTADEFNDALTQLIERAPKGLGLFAWVQSAPGKLPSLHMEGSSGTEQMAQIAALAMRLAGEMMTGGAPIPGGEQR